MLMDNLLLNSRNDLKLRNMLGFKKECFEYLVALITTKKREIYHDKFENS